MLVLTMPCEAMGLLQNVSTLKGLRTVLCDGSGVGEEGVPYVDGDLWK